MNYQKLLLAQISFKRFGFFAAILLTGLLMFTAVSTQPAAAQSLNDLDADEVAALLYMREEEKLAHDVYVTMYVQWGNSIFNNIAAAEQTHTDSVLQLMALYGIADPAADNGVGEFVNSDLQALYDDLVAQGSQSLTEALLGGGLIEETDILDLQASIADTSHADIQLVYQNLLSGSENHLRSFASVYEQMTGEPYQPQLLDQATFDAIISGSNGNGNGRRGGRWGNGGQGNGVGNGGFGRNGR